MQKIFSIIIFVLLLSCSKDGNSPSNNNNGTISFDANGQHVEYDGSFASAQTTASGVYGIKANNQYIHIYQLEGASGPNNAILFQVYTDTLQQQTYFLHPVSQLPILGMVFISINGKTYAAWDTSQVFTLDVTRHSVGTLDATFSGNLYSPKDSLDLNKGFDSIIVTNGSINNMEMIY